MTDAPTKTDHLNATNGVVHELFTQHQGWFSMLNLLGQMGNERGAREHFDAVEERLKHIIEWGKAMWEGTYLLRADGDTDMEGPLVQCLSYLEIQADALEELAEALQIIGQSTSPSLSDGQAVAGAKVWAAYAYEHAIKGTIGFGQMSGQHEIADRARQQLMTAQQGIAVAHQFASLFSNPALEPVHIQDLIVADAKNIWPALAAHAANARHLRKGIDFA